MIASSTPGPSGQCGTHAARATRARDTNRMGRISSTAALLVATLAAGCGYVRAGTWVDDPGNWSRAFQSTKPADVSVIHSNKLGAQLTGRSSSSISSRSSQPESERTAFQRKQAPANNRGGSGDGQK